MDRPATSERLRHEGPPTTPRQSASVILVRDAPGGLELLLVRRNPRQRFMGGFWVFPGGAVDAGEEHRAAAMRELAEEAGVQEIGADALVPYARWITPELIETRFDTLFFVARAPAQARPRVDGRECVELRWMAPRAAVAAYADGGLALVLPTLTLLEGLAGFATVDDLLGHAHGIVIEPILPRIELAGGDLSVLLPGDRGYAT